MALGGNGTYIHYVCMEIVEHTFQITTTQYFLYFFLLKSISVSLLPPIKTNFEYLFGV